MFLRGAKLSCGAAVGCIGASYAELYGRLSLAPFEPGAPASTAPQTGRLLSERCLETTVMSVLGLYSKFAMQVCNTTRFDNDALLRRLIAEGPAAAERGGRGLVTVSNHVTAVDDPGVVATLIPPTHFAAPQHLRWQMCAADRCFKKRALLPFFRGGRVLPVQRGGGPHHHFIDDTVRKLEAGDWVHVFPTGRRDPDSRTLGQLKPGVGRMIASAEPPPVVVPFYHYGMERIQRLKEGEVVPLTFGANMHVVVGEPLEFGPLVREYRANGHSEQQLHAAIVATIDGAMRGLQARALARADADTSGRSNLDRPKWPWSKG